jgi:hypothetical protein
MNADYLFASFTPDWELRHDYHNGLSVPKYSQSITDEIEHLEIKRGYQSLVKYKLFESTSSLSKDQERRN